jgi:hypothetical protein
MRGGQPGRNHSIETMDEHEFTLNPAVWARKLFANHGWMRINPARLTPQPQWRAAFIYAASTHETLLRNRTLKRHE